MGFITGVIAKWINDVSAGFPHDDGEGVCNFEVLMRACRAGSPILSIVDNSAREHNPPRVPVSIANLIYVTSSPLA